MTKRLEAVTLDWDVVPTFTPANARKWGWSEEKIERVFGKDEDKKAARWRTLKDGRHVAISGTEKRGAMSSRGEAAMRDIERQLSGLSVEGAVCMSPGGETLFRQVGNRESVTFDYDQFSKMEDAVLTHNHPGPWGSFSASDVVLASEKNLAEIRVVARDPETDKRYLWKISRPPGGWDLGPLTIRRSYLSSMDKYKGETWPKVRSGAISLERANFDVRDQIWREMWPNNYTREEL